MVGIFLFTGIRNTIALFSFNQTITILVTIDCPFPDKQHIPIYFNEKIKCL